MPHDRHVNLSARKSSELLPHSGHFMDHHQSRESGGLHHNTPKRRIGAVSRIRLPGDIIQPYLMAALTVRGESMVPFAPSEGRPQGRRPPRGRCAPWGRVRSRGPAAARRRWGRASYRRACVESRLWHENRPFSRPRPGRSRLWHEFSQPPAPLLKHFRRSRACRPESAPGDSCQMRDLPGQGLENGRFSCQRRELGHVNPVLTWPSPWPRLLARSRAAHAVQTRMSELPASGMQTQLINLSSACRNGQTRQVREALTLMISGFRSCRSHRWEREFTYVISACTLRSNNQYGI